MITKRTVFSFILFSIIFFGIQLRVQAQLNPPATTELYGVAWSENIGWISFNSCDENGQNCGTTPYSVSVDNQNGHVTGAAWSENIGWLKFGDLSDFPKGKGSVKDNAKMNLSEGTPSFGKFEGWARFCAGTLPGDCSTMDDSTNGWDGWVSLSGSLHASPDISGNGGVTYVEATGKIVGKAWGGDTVGWIDFWDVKFGLSQPFEYTLSNPTEAPGTPLTVAQGGGGSTSVTRTLVSGTPENVSLVALNVPAGAGVTIDTNQPCSPTCSSVVTVTDGGSLPLGSYSFDVRGDTEVNGDFPTTKVRFTVTPPPFTPILSCVSEGGPFFIPSSPEVTWVAEVENPTGDETFMWEGDDSLACVDQPQEECQITKKTYSSVGTKHARVSIDGGANFAECEATIGVIMQFREF